MSQTRNQLFPSHSDQDTEFAVVDELACWILHSMAISGASLKETSFFFTKLEQPYVS